jgi:hypothetical protein
MPEKKLAGRDRGDRENPIQKAHERRCAARDVASMTAGMPKIE